MLAKILLILVVLRTVWRVGLEIVNLSHSTSRGVQIPEVLKNRITPETFEESKIYLKDTTKLKIASEFTQLLVVIYLVLDGLARLEKTFLNYPSFLQALLFFGTLASIFYAVNLPFRICSIFVVEKRHGFSTTTKGTFIKDQIITVFLGAIVLIVLVYVLVWLLQFRTWWWRASILAFGLIIFLQLIQPLLIAPLFYKFRELEDEDLKSEIHSLIERASVRIPNIYVMNASKRTRKKNAYVSGVGKSRRLVLYDTLMEYPKEELLAIVAHELGHHVKKHIQKGIATSSVYAALLLYLANFLYQYVVKERAFNVQSPYTVFTLVLLFVSTLSYFLEPLINWLSRRMEYEADEFAVKLLKSPVPMILALKRLVGENLSNLNPSPIYKAWYYTHPAPEERIKNLQRSFSQG